MVSYSDVATDPRWLPHAIDPQSRHIEFIRIPNEILQRPGFLFEYQPKSDSERARLSYDQVLGLEVDTVPAHFIFHSGFCRSTLLARALNLENVSLSLCEPGIIASLASGMPVDERLTRQLLRLLARPRDGEKCVFIKPTNHANRLIPVLLRLMPEARAILMTNALEPFLRSVGSRTLLGRRWGRQLYLEIQSYARVELNLSQQEVFSLTDMQASGLAWLASQRYFDLLQKSEFQPRLRLLDGNDFNDHRDRTLSAVLEHCHVRDGEALPVVESAAKVFEQHSKLGGNFKKKAPDRTDDLIAKEISEVEKWIGLIAEQLQLDVPLRTNLWGYRMHEGCNH